jgi:phospholipid/cholesterol/gamma-HCH transport system substrate-binding protein
MKTTEQLKAMDMMAVNPIARVVAPRFWGGVISMPLLAALFSAMGVFGGWLIGVVVIGVDDGAFWSQMQAAVEFRYDVVNGVIKSGVRHRGVADRGVRGLRLPADRRGRVARDHPHRGDLRAGDPGAGFRADVLHVQGLMMSRTALDLWVGVFVAIGFAALVFLASRSAISPASTAQRPIASRPPSTTSAGSRCARRSRAGRRARGAGRGDPLRPAIYRAVVELEIDKRYAFPADTTASILTSGLLGEQYVGLEAGADTAMLKGGDRVLITQSAVVLEKLIGQFMFDRAADAPAQ